MAVALGVAAGLCLPSTVLGALVITEVMYDVPGTDTGREWIEVQNIGAEPVDLSAWKLFEANVAHKIAAVGPAIIPAGSFAVIADVPDKFIADTSGFSGLLFDSAFSLSGTGEPLSLRDPAGVGGEAVAYDPSIGAAGDGLSLQRTESAWIAAAPTPGSKTTATESNHAPDEESEEVAGSSAGTASSKGAVSAHASQADANTASDAADLLVTSGRPRLGFVGVPLSFEAKLKSSKTAKSIDELDHFWSMGDGTVRAGRQVWHTYLYPGEYTVVLNSGASASRAVSKVAVRIIEPKVSIREANPEFIEIQNEAEYELNVGGWIVETKGVRFAIGDDTLVAPHGSLRLPSLVTHLGGLREYVRLSVPVGKTMSLVRIDAPQELLVSLPDGLDETAFTERLKRYLEAR